MVKTVNSTLVVNSYRQSGPGSVLKLSGSHRLEPGATKIGWIGTGVMGRSMCRHLMSAGYEMTLYSRTPSKAAELLEAGAAWAETPKAVAARSDIVFSIVGFPSDVREVILGENGAVHGAKAGSVLVDMTTSQPSLAEEIDAVARTQGLHSIDAPVSGGDIGAREARLSIMIGGEKEVVEALMPCWDFGISCAGKEFYFLD